MALVITKKMVQPTIAKHLLSKAADGLQKTLVWQVQKRELDRKVAILRFMTRCFHRQLEQQTVFEETDGYMVMATATCPWLSRKVETLREELHRQVEAARWAVYRLDQIPPTDQGEFADICNDLAALLHRVQQHARKEFALVQEALARDIGSEG